MRAAVYRLQFHKDFTFTQAKEMLSYLQELGITCIYSSPITQANPGSKHGYDVTDTNTINPELGGHPAFLAFVEALHNHNMQLIIDIVPNHMAANTNNAWWKDVLENREKSAFADYFDINWSYSDSKTLLYRRFFDINELVCLRMQDPLVFAATHQLIENLLQHHAIAGIRIDHIDGLIEPTTYLQTLQTLTGKSFYIILEKILAKDEKLPQQWQVSGTTGYDFLNEVNQIFVYPPGLQHIIQNYITLTDQQKNIQDMRYENNKLVIHALFYKELNLLVEQLNLLANELGQAFKKSELEQNLIEVSARIPVYRTYIETNIVSEQDKQVIEKIFLQLPKNPILDFIHNILLLDFPENMTQDMQQNWLNWIKRWQVFTAPVVAKGYEDTSCYIYNPLISLNEVGSSPGYFHNVASLEHFHAYNRYKAAMYPYSFNATSTHDTKRSEDVRARINVLSELFQTWDTHVQQWLAWNAKSKSRLNNQLVPDHNDELLIYQTLLGAWPLCANEINDFKLRLKKYLIKAIREAKIHSNWAQPNQDYEKGLQNFCDAILSPTPDNLFLNDFFVLQKSVAFYGMLNSLVQTTLKITCPGVPDFYQGNEVWRFDLVDPDDRRPIDFKKNKELFMLMQKDEVNINHLMQDWQNGQIKLYIIYKLLSLRHAYPELFTTKEYIPLHVSGKKSQHVVTFMRTSSHASFLVALPRWCSHLTAVDHFPLATCWEETTITLPHPAKSCESIFTNEVTVINENSQHYQLPVSQLFKHFPLFVGLINK